MNYVVTVWFILLAEHKQFKGFQLSKPLYVLSLIPVL